MSEIEDMAKAGEWLPVADRATGKMQVACLMEDIFFSPEAQARIAPYWQGRSLADPDFVEELIRRGVLEMVQPAPPKVHAGHLIGIPYG
jgi:hypothetical protein